MSAKKYYAGIGSRKTPKDICELMTRVARYLYFKGYTLRSGAADGADTAFEIGAGQEKLVTRLFKKKEEYYNIQFYDDGEQIRVISALRQSD